jgi:exodeoxyribonuclease X
MNNTIILDTETTGLEDPRLVQLAFKLHGKETVSHMFKPPKPIEIGATATHHITNEMVADKEPFEKSSVKIALEGLLEKNVLVAHNAKFDLKVLKNEGVECKFFIDTLRLARHLTESEKHNLQHLRYFFKIDVSAKAHDAAGDVDVLEKIFGKLVEIGKTASGISEHRELMVYLIELSRQPCLIKIMTFGKHRGRTFLEILHDSRDYLEWLVRTKEEEVRLGKIDPDDDILYSALTWLNHERPN